MQIGSSTPPEHMRSQPDQSNVMLAEIRMMQKTAIVIIQETLKKNDEMNKLALSTDYEKNFSRVNLLV